MNEFRQVMRYVMPGALSLLILLAGCYLINEILADEMLAILKNGFGIVGVLAAFVLGYIYSSVYYFLRDKEWCLCANDHKDLIELLEESFEINFCLYQNKKSSFGSDKFKTIRRRWELFNLIWHTIPICQERKEYTERIAGNLLSVKHGYGAAIIGVLFIIFILLIMLFYFRNSALVYWYLVILFFLVICPAITFVLCANFKKTKDTVRVLYDSVIYHEVCENKELHGECYRLVV